MCIRDRRIDNTDGDGFKDGDYYFGGEDDGAMTTGWLQMDITYDEATNDYEIAPVFNEDEDQSRWFYFQSNGKKVKAKDGDVQKSKTINGKKYEFDQHGAMTAEWSLDVEKASKDGVRSGNSSSSTNSVAAQYAKEWRYFNSVEDGARVSRGWFKVVAAEYLNYDKYNDDEDAWYYADGSGNLYAGEFKTIKGKKYAFRNDGRMVNGLKFIKGEGTGSLTVVADDDLDDHLFDDEDRFDQNAPWFEANGYHCYYFGDGDDGAMRTNKTSVAIDGDNYNFYFEKSGGNKGAGKTGEKDDKYYQSGKLVRAGSDEKYQVVQYVNVANTAEGYFKLDDADDFIAALPSSYHVDTDIKQANLDALGINKKLDDIQEIAVITRDVRNTDGTIEVKNGTDTDEFFLVNTSGKVIDSKSKNKDGNDYQFVVAKGGAILGYYVED